MPCNMLQIWMLLKTYCMEDTNRLWASCERNEEWLGNTYPLSLSNPCIRWTHCLCPKECLRGFRAVSLTTVVTLSGKPSSEMETQSTTIQGYSYSNAVLPDQSPNSWVHLFLHIYFGPQLIYPGNSFKKPNPGSLPTSQTALRHGGCQMRILLSHTKWRP